MKTLLKIGLAAVALSACVTALVVRAGSNTPTLYAVTNLGPGIAFKANNPDDSGTFLVVGATPDPVVGERATVWTVTTAGTLVDVFTYDTLGNSSANDVNDEGLIVGFSVLGAFVDIPGVGVKILPGASHDAVAVSNRGDVVGDVFDPPGSDMVKNALWHVDATGAITGPVVINAGLGATFTPRDINDDGTMAGSLATGTNVESAAIAEFDSNGEVDVENLGVLHPGDAAIGRSINSDATIVGGAFGKTTAAFLWSPTQPNKLTSLGDLGGGNSTALDINNACQVVGSSMTKANVFAGFIWQNGKLTNLNTVLTAPLNDLIDTAWGINDAGHIVGFTQSLNAFVLTPQ
jgi:probable HAF family extracellular repeat protein